MKTNKFTLFSNVKAVYGFKNAILIDLQRSIVYSVPHSFKVFIEYATGKTLKQICNYFDDDIDDVKSYLEFILDNELGLFTENIKYFSEMEFNWQSPFQITNAIIDIKNEHNLEVYR